MDTIFHVEFSGLGLEFALNRVAFSIGDFQVYWYGILIATGLLLAMAFAFRYAPDFGINADRLVDVVAIGTVMAIICARIAYVAMAPFEYESVWEMLDIRQGGIAIYGGIIGAFVFGGLAARWRKIPLRPLFDVVGMGFFIGQGIGRWGNFMNQEAFGCNTTLPWGMYSEGTYRYLSNMQQTLAAQGVTVDPTQPVHPTFLYESLWCLFGFLVLFLYMRHRRFHGQLFLMYLLWYGLGRYWIEGLRTDSLLIGNTNLRFSQVVALITVAASLVLLVYGLRKSRGHTPMVTLAVDDLKKQQEAGDRFTPDTLPANAGHKEFVAATAAMNLRLKELDLSAAEEPEAVEPVEEPAEEVAAEPEAPETAPAEENTAADTAEGEETRPE